MLIKIVVTEHEETSSERVYILRHNFDSQDGERKLTTIKRTCSGVYNFARARYRNNARRSRKRNYAQLYSMEK